MFTELRIRNFRLFEDLTIKGLRRINLFVGKNNSGIDWQAAIASSPRGTSGGGT